MSGTPAGQKPGPETSPRIRLSRVVFPVVLAGLLIVIVVLALAVEASPVSLDRPEEQWSIIANVMLICLVLCPLIVCGGVFYLLLAAAIFGVHRLHVVTERSLRKLEGTTRTMTDKTASVSESLSRKSVGINQRFEFLNRGFNRPETDTNHPESETDDE